MTDERYNPLPPEAFPIQVVDRALFLATQVLLCTVDDAAMARELAARLNAGEMWRLGLEPPVETPIPDTADETDDDDGPGWALTGATIQSSPNLP